MIHTKKLKLMINMKGNDHWKSKNDKCKKSEVDNFNVHCELKWYSIQFNSSIF